MMYLLGTKKHSKIKLDVSGKNNDKAVKPDKGISRKLLQEYDIRERQYRNFQTKYNQMAATNRDLYTYYTDLENNYNAAKKSLSIIDDTDYVNEWSGKLEDLYHKMKQ